MTDAVRINEKWPGPLEIQINTHVFGVSIALFQLIRSYIDLIEPLNVTPTKGLSTLYEYRSGVLDGNLKLVTETYEQSAEFKKKLKTFGHSCICSNIIMYCDILMKAIEKDLQDKTNSSKFLTAPFLKKLDRFLVDMKHINNKNYNAVLNEIAQMAYLEAHEPAVGVESAAQLIVFFNRVRTESFSQGDFRNEYLPLLKIIYHIACRYYEIQPQRLLALRDQIRYDEAEKMMDSTLAALPLSPALLASCNDRAVSSSSPALIYIHYIRQTLDSLYVLKQ